MQLKLILSCSPLIHLTLFCYHLIYSTILQCYCIIICSICSDSQNSILDVPLSTLRHSPLHYSTLRYSFLFCSTLLCTRILFSITPCQSATDTNPRTSTQATLPIKKCPRLPINSLLFLFLFLFLIE